MNWGKFFAYSKEKAKTTAILIFLLGFFYYLVALIALPFNQFQAIELVGGWTVLAGLFLVPFAFVPFVFAFSYLFACAQESRKNFPMVALSYIFSFMLLMALAQWLAPYLLPFVPSFIPSIVD